MTPGTLCIVDPTGRLESDFVKRIAARVSGRVIVTKKCVANASGRPFWLTLPPTIVHADDSHAPGRRVEAALSQDWLRPIGETDPPLVLVEPDDIAAG